MTTITVRTYDTNGTNSPQKLDVYTLPKRLESREELCHTEGEVAALERGWNKIETEEGYRPTPGLNSGDNYYISPITVNVDVVINPQEPVSFYVHGKHELNCTADMGGVSWHKLNLRASSGVGLTTRLRYRLQT